MCIYPSLSPNLSHLDVKHGKVVASAHQSAPQTCMPVVRRGSSCLLMCCSLASCRRAVLLNLKYNETIASFGNAAGVGLGEQLRASAAKPKPGGGACTCIAFRTGQPLMHHRS